MKYIFALVAGLGTALSAAAETDCIRHLEKADSVLDRAAVLETQLVELCQSSSPPEVIVQTCQMLNKRLARLLEDLSQKPGAVEAAIERIKRDTDHLRRFLADFHEYPGKLETYLNYPEFLKAETRYTTREGLQVHFSEALVSELRKLDRLAPHALHALNQGRMIRLTSDSEVVEVRIRVREFGNARMYGMISGSELWLDQVTLNHMRSRDIPEIIKKVHRNYSKR